MMADIMKQYRSHSIAWHVAHTRLMEECDMTSDEAYAHLEDKGYDIDLNWVAGMNAATKEEE